MILNHDTAACAAVHEEHEGFGEEKSLFAADDPSRKIINAAFKVHAALGPGLLENIYEHCLVLELQKHGLTVERQKIMPVFYDGQKMDLGYRLDIVVDGFFVIEVKAVEKLIPLHEAQLLTYLKLSEIKTGFLMNFNVQYFKDGLKRLQR